MRRSGGSPGKTEGERSPVGHGPPKSCLDVKLERTHDGQEQHSAVEKPKLLSESPGILIVIEVECVHFETLGAQGLFLCFPGVLERVKSELREEVSGNSSVSDMESDSDSPTEVNITISRKQYPVNRFAALFVI